ncbi:hypothetical protein [Jiangella rhizosphaerae]|uniref:hypothetical protein n=1 Tax=Jiangella rhizosphaerae TaxID=2293569 RepID=UPI0011C410ED|nr:hypothetical protein [Jiangella rhizosphaerae]
MSESQIESDTDFLIAEYCGRLSCHRPIVQPAGRGRRREFCSETCRRGTDREYERAKAWVEHFEQYLRRTRHEVAAYGRKAEVDGGFRTPEEEAQVLGAARAAISRAEGVIDLADGDSADVARVYGDLVDGGAQGEVVAVTGPVPSPR